MDGDSGRGGSRADAKFLKVRDILRERILSGEFAVGSRLPSVRELSRIMGISTLTISRGIQELANEGLVAPRRGAGGTTVLRTIARITGKDAPDQTFVCLFRPYKQRNEIDNFGLELMDAIHTRISVTGHRMVMHRLDEPDCIQRVIQTVHAVHAAGIIVDQRIDDASLQQLSELGCPVVIYNRLVALPNVTSVAADYQRCGRETVRYLLEKGYERLLFYRIIPEGAMPFSESYILTSLLQGFRTGVAEAGLAPEMVTWLPESEGGEHPTPAYFRLPAKKERGWKRLGVFTTSDRLGTLFLQALAQTNLKLGSDVGLVGYGNLECNTSLPKPFDSWGQNRKALGEESVNQLLERIQHPDETPLFIKTPIELVQRGSA